MLKSTFVALLHLASWLWDALKDDRSLYVTWDGESAETNSYCQADHGGQVIPGEGTAKQEHCLHTKT